MTAPQSSLDYFKFCPGEEQVKISNAICRGRRRASFPKCPGCQFNDDEKKSASSPASGRGEPPAAIDAVFATYDVRGVVPSPLTTDAAWRVGHAAAQYLHGKLRGFDRAHPSSRSIVVGRDMRSSSIDLQKSLIEGIRSVGMDVINIGVVDTPQVHFAVTHFTACGGIQTTGGSWPAHYNGFKLCGARGVAIADHTGLAGIRDIAVRVPRHLTGMTARLREEDITSHYIRYLRRNVPADGLQRPMRVAIDAGDGVASHLAPLVFGDVSNLEIVPLHFETTEPFAHDPDPCDPGNTLDLRRCVKEKKADLGIAFNGDADQCVFIDEKGAIVPADQIAALLARGLLERHRGSTIVLDHRCGMAVLDEIQRAGGVVFRERVGYPFMRKKMLESDAAFGADLDGRFYFRESNCCESPFLAGLRVLSAMGVTGRKLGELVHPLQKFRNSGNLRIRCTDAERVLKDVAAAHRDAQIDHIEGVTIRYPDWWFNVRRGEGDGFVNLLLEAKTRKLVEQRITELTPLIGAPE